MRIIFGMLIGAAIGYAIGYFGRCAGGVCLLTSNPIRSAIVGALLGAMIVLVK